MFGMLLTILIIVAVIMVAVILLQKSEGSGLSGSSAAAMFGGALTGASAGNFFTRLTGWLATIFFVLCATLAVIVSRQGKNLGMEESEIREELAKPAAAQTAPAAKTPAAKDAAPEAKEPLPNPETDIPESSEN